MVASLLVFVSSRPAEAAVVVPFGVEFQTNDNGAIRLFGNNVLTCPVVPSDPNRCLNARNGTGPDNTLNDNNHVMVIRRRRRRPATQLVELDGGPARGLDRPVGGPLLGRPAHRRARGAGRPAGAARTQMKLRPPGAAGYRTMVPSRRSARPAPTRRTSGSPTSPTIVQAAGPGVYWGADVAAGTGEDRYGGWSLAVVYRNPTLPLRNLTVFDGFADVGQNDPVTVGISGFLAPETGRSRPSSAWSPTTATAGPRATRRSPGAAPNPDTLLGTNLSPGTNFFNSTHDLNGATSRPARRATSTCSASTSRTSAPRAPYPTAPRRPASSSPAPATATSPGVLTTTIDLFSPDFSPSTKTVVNLAGNDPAAPGDTLEYTLSYINAGQDGAEDVVATDPIPAGRPTCPARSRCLAGPDAGCQDRRGRRRPGRARAATSVVFRLGTGATGTARRRPAAGRRRRRSGSGSPSTTRPRARPSSTRPRSPTCAAPSATVHLRPQPDADAGDTVADLSLTKTTSPDPGSPAARHSTLTVQNAGPSPAADVVVTDELPDGVTFVGATPGCTTAGTAVTCAVGAVAAGATATVHGDPRHPAGLERRARSSTSRSSTPARPTPIPTTTRPGPRWRSPGRPTSP